MALFVTGDMLEFILLQVEKFKRKPRCKLVSELHF